MLWKRCLAMAFILESPAHPVKSLTSTCPAPGAHFSVLTSGLGVTGSNVSRFWRAIDPNLSSASRFTAGALGFFDFIQCGERPEA
jgi:hypothetical protein